MSFVNVGAMNRDGIRYPSKKALKTALAENPSEVIFDQTSAFPQGDLRICADSLPAGDTLSVCGPDPYSDRRWYANVSVGAKGPKVS